MKVNWDNIIQEDHTPSRVSRRLVKMLGGFLPTSAPSGPVLGGTPLDQGLAAASFIGGPATAIIGSLISGIATAATPFMGDYQSRYSPEDYIKTGAEVKAEYDAWEFNRLLQLKSQFPKQPWRWEKQLRDMGYDDSRYRLAAVDPIVEAAKAAKQREEDRIIVQQNETYAAMLRNEQNQKDASDRALARTRTITAQNTARVRAAQQNTTTIQGELERIKAAATATAEAKGQNLKSLHALATQRGVVAATEAEQQKMIQANTAQILAQQNAEVARLRAEALAKQGQIRAVAPVVSRKAKAPQVKFGGSKSSGYVQKLIEMDKLDPEAELFDADLIQDPSKYIQTQMYEKSGRVRQGIKKIKEIQKKNIVTRAIKKYIGRRRAELFDTTFDEIGKFALSWKKNGVEGVTYSAAYFTSQLMLLYLLKKYKGNETLIIQYNPFLNTFALGLTYNGGDKFTIEPEIVTNKKITPSQVVNNIVSDIKEAIKLKKKLVIIPFSFETNPKWAKDNNIQMQGHKNMLIYRTENNTLERFEPHGEEFQRGNPNWVKRNFGYTDQEMNTAIETFFRTKMKKITDPEQRADKKPFKFISSRDLHYKGNFQYVRGMQEEEGIGLSELKKEKPEVDFPGFCQMWSFFYLELVMKFPEEEGATLVKKSSEALTKKGGPKRFLEHMLGYVEHFKKEINEIVKTTSNYKMPEFSFDLMERFELSKRPFVGKPYNDWYNTNKELIDDWSKIREWYNGQIRDLMTKNRMARYIKTGAGIIPSE